MIKQLIKNVKLHSLPSLVAIYISRCCMRLFGWAPFNRVVLDFDNCQMNLTVAGGDGLIFWNEIASYNPYRLLFEHVGYCNFIDCGANTGAVICKLIKTNSKLRGFAFEPHPMTFSKLKSNVELNGISSAVDLFNNALGATAGSIEMSVRGSESMAVVKNSTFGANDEDSEIVNIQQVTIDDCMDSISGEVIIKIDVEGWELEVLKGSLKTLARTSKIVVECHTEELLESCSKLLKEQNFTLEKLPFPNGLWILNAWK